MENHHEKSEKGAFHQIKQLKDQQTLTTENSLVWHEESGNLV